MKVKLVHIPKTAGTTIKNIFKQNINFSCCLDHTYAIENDLSNVFSFAIVRNPWDRLWSGYNFYRNGSDYKQPNSSKLINLPFTDFIYTIYKNNLYNEYKSMRSNEALIYHKQVNWILDKNGNQAIDHIGRFENIKDLLSILEMKTGSAGIVDTFNKTHINKTKNKVHYTEVYTEETINLVGEMYSDDIKFLNYDYISI